MRPTPHLDMVIFTLQQNIPESEPLTLDNVDDQLAKVGKENLSFDAKTISDLKVELNDLVAAYGAEFDAKSIWDRSAPEKSLYLQTNKDCAMQVTHIINPNDVNFTNNLYSIELPSGNFSVAYGVFANNEQDALDELADHETERLKHNPDISIFKVDTTSYNADELQEYEDHGEFSRIGNEGDLYDTSNIAIHKAELISIDSTIDINEYLQEKKRLFKSTTPSPGM